MMYDLILLARHEAELRAICEEAGETEVAAYVAFGIADLDRDPWTNAPRRRLVSHQVIPIVPEEKVSASATHVTWSTRGLIRELSRLTAESLVLGIVHSHPGGAAIYSDQDDRNEAELFRAVANRNGHKAELASLLLGGDGTIACRVWHGEGLVSLVSRILVAGARLRLHNDANTTDRDAETIWDRQTRLFGATFNRTLHRFKIGVIGCGGTGSAVALLLARLGVQHLALIDPDVIEATNLNRVHGSRRSDAVSAWVGWQSARNVLKSCDVIFGCTDDHDGRLLLNRLAYFYGIPLIDVGLRMRPAQPPVPYNIVARVSTVLPGHSCLLCRGLIDPRRASEEDLARSNPAEYGRRKTEAYVEGGGDPAPAVVTFTTEAAAMAVNELIQGLTNFREQPGMVPGRFRQFELGQDRAVAPAPREGCRICDNHKDWGRADVEPFLYRMGT
jgi:hypothetical protein